MKTLDNTLDTRKQAKALKGSRPTCLDGRDRGKEERSADKSRLQSFEALIPNVGNKYKRKENKDGRSI